MIEAGYQCETYATSQTSNIIMLSVPLWKNKIKEVKTGYLAFWTLRLFQVANTVLLLLVY